MIITLFSINIDAVTDYNIKIAFFIIYVLINISNNKYSVITTISSIYIYIYIYIYMLFKNKVI